MKKTKTVVYMVIYRDDFHKKHITFVKKYSEVKFLEERFGIIEFKIVQQVEHLLDNFI